MQSEKVASSFRDPSGFVFRYDGSIYRQINESYRADYDRLMNSGLYDALVSESLLVSHEEVSGVPVPEPNGAFRVIKPQQVPFVSYPYEWCFSQLKDAALTTIKVQKTALKFGQTLKDCSAYNIQFVRGKPVFIDTLSFEEYVEGMPWKPYRQFCQHFLAPLSLMSLVDIRLNTLLRGFIDGIPLDLASRVLPYRTRFNFPLLLHIHLHARSQNRYSDRTIDKKEFARGVSKTALLGLLDSLESAVRRLSWKPAGTEWADYYSDDSYTPAGLEHKKTLVAEYLAEAAPRTVWDLGANTGLHSRLACEVGAEVVAFDIDPAAVEINYLQVREAGEESILPLLLDLTNPSPALGWANDERMSLLDRAPADLVMGLALIHHLAISNNVPLSKLAAFFASVCRNYLIIEFVPKSDKKVQKLLATRDDVFPDYNQECFEREFRAFFDIVRSDRVNDSERTVYLMRRL